MRNHSEYSEQIIQPLATHSFFSQVQPAVRGHHERLDGKGYPDSLSGEEIPLVSRVILIVDTLDAMSENRAYRQGLPIDKVYEELKKYSGTQFDASLVNVFLQSHKSWHTEEVDENSWSQVTGRHLRAA
jgi:HD-GYP domain-containing protein (c-di-GMP phosphodiesterase class II)